MKTEDGRNGINQYAWMRTKDLQETPEIDELFYKSRN